MYINANIFGKIARKKSRSRFVSLGFQDVSDDLEQVEVMQKKFDDFQSDLKANEVRLAEMNEIAMQLVTLGQTDAAIKIQAQLEDLVRFF
jgi:hypothetical protein